MPRNAHDVEWLGLGLTPDALGASLTVQERHLSPVGRLYGGAAVAAAVTMMEEATGRETAWVTVQFASTGRLGDILSLRATVPAAGHRTAQVRVVAHLGDAEVFAALGAVRSGGGAGAGLRHWDVPSAVPPPEACRDLIPPADLAEGAPHLAGTELRLAAEDRPAGRLRLWVRPAQAGRTSAAVLGWYADLVGMVLLSASGAEGATSLDNTVRLGPAADPVDEWFLADLRAQAVHDGLAHGRADLWSPAGTLLAAASQTCVLHGVAPTP